MADEITITTGMRLVNGALKVELGNTTTTFDQTTARGGGPGTIDVSTAEETIDFVDTVPGFVMIKNLDPTNFVEYGLTTGQLGLKLRPNGGFGFLEIGTGSLIMKADTATCKVQIVAINV